MRKKITTEELGNNENSNIMYDYNNCDFKIEKDIAIIELYETSPVSVTKFIFKMDKRGNIVFVNEGKRGKYFEEGEWKIYE